MVALDLLFQIHVVRFEPRVQLFDHRDVGAKRALVAPALQRRRQDLGQQLQPFDQQLAASAAAPGRCRRPVRRSRGRPERRRHAEDGIGARPRATLAAGDRLRGSSSGREIDTSSPRARRSTSQASGPDACRPSAGRSRYRWRRAPASTRPTRRTRAAGSHRRGWPRRPRRGPRRSPPACLERHPRQPPRQCHGELGELVEIRFRSSVTPRC